MGIFDIFSSGSDKKIYSKEFRNSLRRIADLSPEERAYIEEAFGKELEEGLSEYELKKRCRELMHKAGDSLEPHEVEQIREKIIKHLE